MVENDFGRKLPASIAGNKKKKMCIRRERKIKTREIGFFTCR